jgi:hypothetical protein
MFSRKVANKYPPAEPEVLRLQAPQRGLTAIGHSQNPNTGDGVLQYPGNVKLWESPRQSRGFSPINNHNQAVGIQAHYNATPILLA